MNGLWVVSVDGRLTVAVTLHWPSAVAWQRRDIFGIGVIPDDTAAVVCAEVPLLSVQLTVQLTVTSSLVL